MRLLIGSSVGAMLSSSSRIAFEITIDMDGEILLELTGASLSSKYYPCR